MPQAARCPNSEFHEMSLVTYCPWTRSKKYVADQQCSKCHNPFNRIYSRNRLLRPHYYICQQCPCLLCFNCTKKSNINDNVIWNDPWKNHNLLWPQKRHYLKPPSFNINRLKLNNLFEESNDAALNKYLKTVMKALGGTKGLLLFITKHSTFQELNEMHDLITKQQKKYIGQDKKPLFDENYFNKIPKACTQHIIGHLPDNDINALGLTCRYLAIECMEERQQSRCYVINAISTINCVNESGNTLNAFESIMRFPKNKTMQSAQTHWREKYGIPLAHQLLFETDYWWRYQDRWKLLDAERYPIMNDI